MTTIKTIGSIQLISITYPSDKLKVQAYILVSKKKQPVVLHVRGGNNHPKHKGSMDLTEEEMLSPRIFNIAKAGYCVMATNFRGSAQSEGVDELGGDDINDIGNLYKLAKLYGDPHRVILYGWSMGCPKILSVIKSNPIWLRYVTAVVLGAPAVDLIATKKFRPMLYNHWRQDFGLSDHDLKQRSPMHFIKELAALKTIPTLILQGMADTKVPVYCTLQFVAELFRNGIQVKLITWPGDGHGLKNNITDVTQEIEKFIHT